MNNRATPGRQHGIELARGLFPSTKWGSVQHFCQGKLPETKFAKVMWGVILLLAAALIAFCIMQWVSSIGGTVRAMPAMSAPTSDTEVVDAPALYQYVRNVGTDTYRVQNYPVRYYWRVMDRQATLVAVQSMSETLDLAGLNTLTEQHQKLQNGLEANGYVFEGRASHIVGLRDNGARNCNVFVRSTDYTVHCSDVSIAEGLLFPRAMALIGR